MSSGVDGWMVVEVVVSEWMDGWSGWSGWRDGWMDGWMNGW